MIRAVKTEGSVCAEEKTISSKHIHGLASCLLACIARLGNIHIHIRERFNLSPCVRIPGKTGMGQDEFKIRHLFQQSFEVALFAEPRMNEERLAGPGQPLGNRSEFHRCKMMPEWMRLDTDESFCVFIFFKLFHLVFLSFGIHKYPSEKLIRMFLDGIEYL